MEIEINNLNFGNSIQLSNQLKMIETKSECIFNFEKADKFSPFGMLFCSSVIRNFRLEHRDIKCSLKYPSTSANISYAGFMGFFKSISTKITLGNLPGEARGSVNYIPVKIIDFTKIIEDSVNQREHVSQVIHNEAEKLAKILSRDNEKLCEYLTYIIRETLRNAQEHSRSKSVWICAQYWPTYQKAEIAILDEGQGIKNSLLKNKDYKTVITDDKTALIWALKPGVSETFKSKFSDYDIWANTGYGLYAASELCTKLGGTFSIVSGNVALVKDMFNKKVYDTCFNGTAIRMTINTSKIDNFKNNITEIIRKGEGEASKIKRAIKKASYSSKGLIDYLN